MCVLVFSTDFVWNISHSKKNLARYDQNCISVCMLSSRYSCHFLMKLEFSRQIFGKKISLSNNSKCIHWELTASMRADGRTDMTKQIVALRNFANAPVKQPEHHNERQRNSAATVTLKCSCRQQPSHSSSLSQEALNHPPNSPLWPMTASSTVLCCWQTVTWYEQQACYFTHNTWSTVISTVRYGRHYSLLHQTPIWITLMC